MSAPVIPFHELQGADFGRRRLAGREPMITDTRPDAIRDQAMAVMAYRLGRTTQLEDALAAFGHVVIVNVLIDLEQAFDIGLEVDEALPRGTVGSLLDLVLLRAQGRVIDRPAAAEACALYDFTAERARRAQGVRLVGVA